MDQQKPKKDETKKVAEPGAMAEKATPFQYELNRDKVSYFLGAEWRGKNIGIVCSMKPATIHETIQLLRDRTISYIQSKTDSDALEFTAPDADEANRTFFDEHMIEILVEKKAVSEKTIDKLDALYKLKGLIVTLGFLGIFVVKKDEDAEREFDPDKEFGDEIETDISFFCVDESDQQMKEVRATVVSRMPRAADRIKWDNCSSSLRLKNNAGTRIRYKHDMIDNLANTMILRVPKGITLNGEPLSIANKEGKDGWDKKLMYIVKFRVLSSIFGLATEKNG